eukprot:CAMPEP_0175042382 /NCGR_PEP_ID=MMETSP0052_2-20121109/2532_1 /TAXON_ID=51329 ORGANISM="Polytomella parva, Strain SAG 63-3" /NCGR_SAMPLE_ID=MMETSP0052_2 /ASSEMBLY_ACC=CAM_ASM_000194 /LENGTH=791 /DNA_ID=CAMNT_0016305187 /DNA_START=93 /DNA_END=2468 /DNA_ORIENTATION=-
MLGDVDRRTNVAWYSVFRNVNEPNLVDAHSMMDNVDHLVKPESDTVESSIDFFAFVQETILSAEKFLMSEISRLSALYDSAPQITEPVELSPSSTLFPSEAEPETLFNVPEVIAPIEAVPTIEITSDSNIINSNVESSSEEVSATTFPLETQLPNNIITIESSPLKEEIASANPPSESKMPENFVEGHVLEAIPDPFIATKVATSAPDHLPLVSETEPTLLPPSSPDVLAETLSSSSPLPDNVSGTATPLNRPFSKLTHSIASSAIWIQAYNGSMILRNKIQDLLAAPAPASLTETSVFSISSSGMRRTGAYLNSIVDKMGHHLGVLQRKIEIGLSQLPSISSSSISPASQTSATSPSYITSVEKEEGEEKTSTTTTLCILGRTVIVPFAPHLLLPLLGLLFVLLLRAVRGFFSSSSAGSKNRIQKQAFADRSSGEGFVYPGEGEHSSASPSTFSRLPNSHGMDSPIANVATAAAAASMMMTPEGSSVPTPGSGSSTRSLSFTPLPQIGFRSPVVVGQSPLDGSRRELFGPAADAMGIKARVFGDRHEVSHASPPQETLTPREDWRCLHPIASSPTPSQRGADLGVESVTGDGTNPAVAAAAVMRAALDPLPAATSASGNEGVQTESLSQRASMSISRRSVHVLTEDEQKKGNGAEEDFYEATSAAKEQSSTAMEQDDTKKGLLGFAPVASLPSTSSSMAAAAVKKAAAVAAESIEVIGRTTRSISKALSKGSQVGTADADLTDTASTVAAVPAEAVFDRHFAVHLECPNRSSVREAYLVGGIAENLFIFG